MKGRRHIGKGNNSGGMFSTVESECRASEVFLNYSFNLSIAVSLVLQEANSEMETGMWEVYQGMLSRSTPWGKGSKWDGTEEDAGLCCKYPHSAEQILWGSGAGMALPCWSLSG